MSPGRVSPTLRWRDYRHEMKPRPFVSPTGWNLAWIIASGIATAAAAAALTIWARPRLPWPPMVTEYVSLIPTVGVWAAVLWWILLRPVYRHLRTQKAMFDSVDEQVRQFENAMADGDDAAARLARARAIAILLTYRATIPANAPDAARLNERLATIWPDASDLPTGDSPAELLERVTTYVAEAQEEVTAALAPVRQAIADLTTATRVMTEAIEDRNLSAAGGFDDPDREAAVNDAARVYAEALTNAKFLLITTADQVAPRAPRLAAELADLYVALSKLPG